MNKYGAIILAAGKGTRFNQEKQFISFRGKPVWRHVYDKAISCVSKENIVVVGVDIPGGATRTESVRIGLNKLKPDTKRVVILEAARPLVTESQINEILADVHESTTFVIPLVNTVILRDGTYLNRHECYEILAPQAFDYLLFKQAHESGRFTDVTDDTRIMFDFHSIRPFFIEGGYNLIKLTYREDFARLEAIADMQMRGEM